ncbi:MAG: hypothetical protein JO328_21325 [Hyphomicrobiales bacterium]|nr:hypothetical protein [Hyphomicrobiales bacterium]MBV9429108.1 hypothetical protein [Bradyrhizobiaceae bacterium]
MTGFGAIAELAVGEVRSPRPSVPSYLTPDQFRLAADPDDTAAFGRLAAAVNAAGTGKVRLTRGYTVYSTVPAGALGYAPLMRFMHVNGLEIDCRGSIITNAYPFSLSSPDVAPLFLMQWCTDVEIHSPTGVQSTNIALPQANPIPGTQLIVPAGSNSGILVTNPQMTGGQALFDCFVGTYVGLVPDEGIALVNPRSYGAQYGMVFAGSGLASSVTGGYVQGAERAIFIYDVGDIGFDVAAQDCLGAEWCLIGATLAPWVENVRGRFTVLPRSAPSASGSDTYVNLEVHPVAGASIRDIELDLHIDYANDTQSTMARAFSFTKATTGALGSLFSNIRIRGSIRNMPVSGGNAVEVFRPADAPWSGESAVGIVLGPFVFEGSDEPAFYCDLAPCKSVGQMMYRDVKFPGALSEVNAAPNARLSSNAVFAGALISP